MTAPTNAMPRIQVSAPGPAPAARYGLFSAATMHEQVEGHALAGIEYEAVCSTHVTPYPAPCAHPAPPEGLPTTKTPAPTTSWAWGSPFALYAADDCALGRDETTARQQLRQRLAYGEQTAVEAIVERGLVGNVPRLIGTAEQPVQLPAGTEPLDPADAVGVLEHWLAAATGGQGVIHAPRWISGRLRSTSVTSVAGPVMQAPLGNTIAFGAGYVGAPPAGQTSDALWLYATRPVTVRRSAVIEPATWSTGTFDTRQNAGLLLVERVYVVDWPCAAAAVPTTLPRRPELAPTPPTQEDA